VDAASAQNPANYTLVPHIPVRSATLAANGMTVMLTTAPLSRGALYRLGIQNVKDRSGSANAVMPGCERPLVGLPRGNWKLAAWWKFDDQAGTTAADSAGDNHAVLKDGPTWVKTERGGALAFDGRDDVVQAPHAPALRVGHRNRDFSVCFWFKLRQGHTGQWRSIMRKAGNKDDRTFALWMWPHDNRVHYRLRSTESWNDGGDSRATVPIDTWTHIACVKQKRSYSLYINGELDSSDTLQGDVVANKGPLTIGKDPWHPGVDAVFDEIMIYHTALDADQIQALMRVSGAVPKGGNP
jgi:hypothetical protein